MFSLKGNRARRTSKDIVQDGHERDKGFFGVFLLIMIAFVTFFTITQFIQGIFSQISCQQDRMVWTDNNPKRYLILFWDKTKNPPIDGEYVYMFGTCMTQQAASIRASEIELESESEFTNGSDK
jgi:hypothetical protein